jgi:hypothetical protein
MISGSVVLKPGQRRSAEGITGNSDSYHRNSLELNKKSQREGDTFQCAPSASSSRPSEVNFSEKPDSVHQPALILDDNYHP